MKYRVFWSPNAEAQLEELLAQHHDEEGIASAAIEIDRNLADDPFGFSESRYDTVRIAFVRPLGVQFEVLSDVRTAIVNFVWWSAGPY